MAGGSGIAEEAGSNLARDTLELETAARHYLDLWEQHIAAMLRHPEYWEESIRLWQAFLKPLMPDMARGTGEAKTAARRTSGETGNATGSQAGTQAAAFSPGNGDAVLGQLKIRLAAAERKLAELEQQLAVVTAYQKRLAMRGRISKEQSPSAKPSRSRKPSSKDRSASAKSQLQSPARPKPEPSPSGGRRRHSAR